MHMLAPYLSACSLDILSGLRLDLIGRTVYVMSFTIKFRNTFDFDVHVDRRDEKSILLGPVYQPFFRSSSAAAAA